MRELNLPAEDSLVLYLRDAERTGTTLESPDSLFASLPTSWRSRVFLPKKLLAIEEKDVVRRIEEHSELENSPFPPSTDKDGAPAPPLFSRSLLKALTTLYPRHLPVDLDPEFNLVQVLGAGNTRITHLSGASVLFDSNELLQHNKLALRHAASNKKVQEFRYDPQVLSKEIPALPRIT